MSDVTHPLAPHALPIFLTARDGTDVMFVLAAATVILAVLGAGVLFLRLHTLPERLAHGAKKLQFEIVAVLGLIALFTHMHLFWIAGLLLALIDIPDWGTPLRRIADSVVRIADAQAPQSREATPDRATEPGAGPAAKQEG